MSDPGSQTLLKCEEQVLVFIRNNFHDVAMFMRDKNIISRKVYYEIKDPVSIMPIRHRVRLLFQELIDKIEEDSHIYEIFIEFLRKCGNPVELTKLLDHTYKNLQSWTKQGGKVLY